MTDHPGQPPTPARTGAEDEVADLLSQLIRINTSNPTHPERPAAEWVAARLAEVGLESEIIESAPGRASVVARVEGRDPGRSPLLIHGHLDVVPAEAAEWSVDPFAGEIRDGFVWGRGSVDMKDMDAMTLAIVRDWQRTGHRPPRDIVLAFVADEEAGGVYGAHHLVDHRPELFADCTEAISEVGGFSVSLNEQLRLYMIQTAEKGIGWLRLKARNRPGHGSMVHPDNAVTQVARAVTRFGDYESPLIMTTAMRELFDEIGALTGLTFDEADPQATLAHFGAGARMLGAALRNTANPTMLQAGYKAHVIPTSAAAPLSCSFAAARSASSPRRPRLLSTRVSCPARRTTGWPRWPNWPATRSRWTGSTATSRSRRPSTVRWWTPWRPRSRPRTRPGIRCPT